MGIELTQRACRRIAAIRKGHDTRLIARFIQCDEGSPRHVHLAAHLQIGRRILDIERNGVNGLYIRRHIFPHAAIPSCQTLDETAVLIDEIHGKSVDLQLRDVLHMVCAKPCLHAAVKVPKLVRIECIRQREHGLSEAHLPEIIGRLPADTLRRGVRCHQLRICFFQIHQLPVHMVEFKIRDLRSVQHIVQVAMMAELFF